MSASHPSRRISFKLSEIAVHFSQEQDGYFLCVKFRIDTISKAVLTIKLSSSYVLIIITTFRRILGTGESTSPGCPGKYIILLLVPRRLGECRGGFLFTLTLHFLADAILLGIRHIDELYCFVKILFNNLFYFV